MIKGKATVYDEIAAATQKRAEVLKDLRDKLAKAEKIKANADKAATDALNSGNADAYTTAKAESRTAADQIEFYNIQITNVETAPLFSDYAEKIAEIKADQQKKMDQINERAAKAMHKIHDAIEQFYSEFDETNKALELVYENTNFTFRPTIAVPIGTVYSSTKAVSVNPELSKYW